MIEANISKQVIDNCPEALRLGIVKVYYKRRNFYFLLFC